MRDSLWEQLAVGNVRHHQLVCRTQIDGREANSCVPVFAKRHDPVRLLQLGRGRTVACAAPSCCCAIGATATKVEGRLRRLARLNSRTRQLHASRTATGHERGALIGVRAVSSAPISAGTIQSMGRRSFCRSARAAAQLHFETFEPELHCWHSVLGGKPSLKCPHYTGA